MSKKEALWVLYPKGSDENRPHNAMLVGVPS